MSKTTARTPRAARAEAHARPDAPPPMTATAGSSGTGVANTTCSWWKLFLMADRREKPDLLRRCGAGLDPPEADTTPARRAAGRRRESGGIAGARRNAGAGARTRTLAVICLFFIFCNLRKTAIGVNLWSEFFSICNPDRASCITQWILLYILL
jgi:hypothetical protein